MTIVIVFPRKWINITPILGNNSLNSLILLCLERSPVGWQATQAHYRLKNSFLPTRSTT